MRVPLRDPFAVPLFPGTLQAQGDQVDSADEKTLMQFILLGDPSIHPVKPLEPGVIASAATIARRQRRIVSLQTGAILTAAIPKRRAVRETTVPDNVAGLARELSERAGAGFNFRFSSPMVERVTNRIRATATAVVGRISLQYYWMARRHDGAVPDVRIVSIQTDTRGNVIRTQILASS